MTATPADVNVKLVKNDGVSKPVNQVNYQSMVGSLLHASIAIRPKQWELYQNLTPVLLKLT